MDTSSWVLPWINSWIVSKCSMALRRLSGERHTSSARGPHPLSAIEDTGSALGLSLGVAGFEAKGRECCNPGRNQCLQFAPSHARNSLSNENRSIQRFSAARMRLVLPFEPNDLEPNDGGLRRSPSKLSGAREFGRDVMIAALPLAKTHRWFAF